MFWIASLPSQRLEEIANRGLPTEALWGDGAGCVHLDFSIFEATFHAGSREEFNKFDVATNCDTGDRARTDDHYERDVRPALMRKREVDKGLVSRCPIPPGDITFAGLRGSPWT